MYIGERFVRDGKLVEVTSINTWGYGFREVSSETFKATADEPVKAEEEVFPETIEPEEEPEEKPVVKRTTKKRTTKK